MTGCFLFLLLLCSFLALRLDFIYAHADYYEHLALQPLPLGSLLASFDFRSNESLEAFEAQNFRFFPRSLGQILQLGGIIAATLAGPVQENQ